MFVFGTNIIHFSDVDDEFCRYVAICLFPSFLKKALLGGGILGPGVFESLVDVAFLSVLRIAFFLDDLYLCFHVLGVCVWHIPFFNLLFWGLFGTAQNCIKSYFFITVTNCLRQTALKGKIYFGSWLQTSSSWPLAP